MQRPAIFSGSNLLLGLASLLARQIFSQRGIGVEARTDLPAAFEVAFSQFHRRDFASADALGKFGDREVEDVFSEHDHFSAARSTSAGWSEFSSL